MVNQGAENEEEEEDDDDDDNPEADRKRVYGLKGNLEQKIRHAKTGPDDPVMTIVSVVLNYYFFFPPPL